VEPIYHLLQPELSYHMPVSLRNFSFWYTFKVNQTLVLCLGTAVFKRDCDTVHTNHTLPITKDF